MQHVLEQAHRPTHDQSRPLMRSVSDPALKFSERRTRHVIVGRVECHELLVTLEHAHVPQTHVLVVRSQEVELLFRQELHTVRDTKGLKVPQRSALCVVKQTQSLVEAARQRHAPQIGAAVTDVAVVTNKLLQCGALA